MKKINLAQLGIVIIGVLMVATFPNSAYATKTLTASWYGPGFHGQKTANCEIFNQNALTVAVLPSQVKEYPFGTKLTLTRTDTGKSVRVRVTDTGGFGKDGRQMDVSKGVARKLGFLETGVVKLVVSDVDRPPKSEYGKCT